MVELHPTDKDYVTLEFKDWLEASRARRVLAPHLGFFARAGFSMRSELAAISGDYERPVPVNVPTSQLDSMLATIPNRIQELRAFAYDGQEGMIRQGEFHTIQDIRHLVRGYLLENPTL